jgi:hypothetical protein
VVNEEGAKKKEKEKEKGKGKKDTGSWSVTEATRVMMEEKGGKKKN